MERTKIKHKYLFIAVKPEYANKLISGKKDIELRKMRPNVQPGDYAIIYASTPIKAVLGMGKIKSIIECSPSVLWDNYSDRLGIDKHIFFSYYDGYFNAVGIEFDMIKAITPIKLEELRIVDPCFRPPQVYRYVTDKDILAVLANRY